MKILYMVDYYQPKLGYGSYYIPRELAKLGHVVTLFTSNYYYPFPRYAETVGKVLGARRVTPGKTKMGRVTVVRKEMIFEIFTRAIISGQEDIIKSFKPDIVIVDKTAGYNQIIASKLKRKFGYTLISLDAHLPSGFSAEGNQIAKKIFYLLFRLLFANLINKTTDKFVAVQEDTRLIMRKYYGIKKPIRHIPLGTDIKLFRYDPDARRTIRRRYGLAEKDFVIIYTGKVIKEKGVEILFAAFNTLCIKNASVRLIIVGSGPNGYKNICFSRLKNKFRQKVIWIEFQKASSLYKFYSASDVGVWPLQESMSMNDAASCGLPFIANNRIGAKMRLSNNNALLYKNGVAKDLAEKIRYLYKNLSVSRAMGKRGRELMEKKLSWARIAREYINV